MGPLVRIHKQYPEEGDLLIARHDVDTDYEKERMRRIKENEDLIKELGL
jgi:hypothetical protein